MANKTTLACETNHEILDKCGDSITDDELSKLACNVIPSEHARPFVLQYLKLTNHEYSNILHKANNTHHDAMVECFNKWKNKQIPNNGFNLRKKLVGLLTEAREDYGWFSNVSYDFLDDTRAFEEDIIGETLSESSMCYFTYVLSVCLYVCWCLRSFFYLLKHTYNTVL